MGRRECLSRYHFITLSPHAHGSRSLRSTLPLALILLLATAGAAAIAAPPEPAPASEGGLWEQIRAFDRTRPRVGPRPTRDVLAALRGQLRRLELYRTLFPGGEHVTQGIAAELETATEIGILSGDFAELYRRVDAWRTNPPVPAAEPEVAYFAILADRLRGRLGHASSMPASRPVPGPDRPPAAEEGLLAAWVRYVQRYPRSRHTPALCEQICDEALRRGDRTTALRMLELLERDWPLRAETRRLRLRLARMPQP